MTCLKNQNGVSNYRMAYQIIVAFRRMHLARCGAHAGLGHSLRSLAFKGCCSLAAVHIGDSVTSIGNGAFYECTSLAAVHIPDSVTLMGWFAFDRCPLLAASIGHLHR